MRKLERGATAPAWLANYDPATDKWEPSDTEKDETWHALNAMQQNLCAYCEADISSRASRRIEHFARRKDHKELTFAWGNLFGSCNSRHSCDIYKDAPGAAPYEWKNLIKPDEYDADQYLLFISDGTIIPRLGLTPEDLHRAEETLRVFNLDHADLRQERKRGIKKQLDSYEKIIAMCAEVPEVLDEEIQILLDKAKTLPFCTAIRHALTLTHVG